MMEHIYPAKSTTKIKLHNHMESCPLQRGTETDSANIGDPRTQSVTQKFKRFFSPVPEHPPHPQNTPVLPRVGEGFLSPLKCLGPHQLWIWDMGQQNRWSLLEMYCWKSRWTEADGMQHTQRLHLRLVPLCHQVTLSSPSPPGPGRDSRFPDIWNFCCAISFGSRGKLQLFISHGCSGTGMYQTAVQVSPCALFTFLMLPAVLGNISRRKSTLGLQL